MDWGLSLNADYLSRSLLIRNSDHLISNCPCFVTVAMHLSISLRLINLANVTDISSRSNNLELAGRHDSPLHMMHHVQ